ncbi:polysaccharide lyase family 8 super-sandwich domain-containing protein [Pseudomonas sp. NPDC090592]|uniref:polysaccharide lyase family 8 super-sandwich domain-containing protein n=1 Tax=Pseudomonas sp. NPDC090592 TaxID=3364480 RepID=UPI00383A4E19
MNLSDAWVEEANRSIKAAPSAWLADAAKMLDYLVARETTAATEATVSKWKADYKDGKFKDIIYPQKQSGRNTAPLYEHLERVQMLASFAVKHNDDASGECAAEALRFYTAQEYATANWYQLKVGLASQVARCLMLLSVRGNAPLESIKYVQALTNVDQQQYAANQVEFAYVQLLWSLAGWKNTSDVTYLAQAYAASRAVSKCCEFASLSAPTWGEGIRTDYSFSQHNPFVIRDKSVCSQLYAGSYGFVFLETVFKFKSALVGVFGLTSASLENIELHLTEGLAWCAYAGRYDFHALGRAISRSRGGGTSAWSRWCGALLPTAKNPDRLREMKELGSGKVMTGPGFRGSRAFWTNDYLSHLDNDFAVFCKVISTRTVGTETGNGENLKGYYMGGGSYFVHTHGKEYEGIQPVWNWQYLPGTTVEEDPHFEYPELRFGRNGWGSHDFAGVLSDGTVGVATMILSRQNINTSRKTIITLAGEVYCLGLTGDLSGVSHNVHTTVNQCWHDTRHVRSETSTGGHSINSGTIRRSDISEVRHDGVVYQFLLPADVTVELTTSRGSWKSINGDQSAEPVSGGTFSLWINHGRVSEDRYAYVIRKAGSVGSQPSFVCSATSQYIVSSTKDLAAGSVFSPSVDIDLEEVKITPKAPLVFVALLKDAKLTLTISDPTQKLDAIEVQLKWKNRTYNHKIILPTDLDYRGKGVTVELTEKGVSA